MKKIASLFALLLVATSIQAQSSACITALNLVPTSTEFYSDYPLTQSEGWFTFTATESDVIIHIDLPDLPVDTPAAHIKKIEVYSGNCNSLSLIAADSIMLHHSDTMPSVRLTALVIGQVYTIKISTHAELITCRKCVPNGAIFFSMSLENLPPPVVSTSCSGYCGNNLAFQGDFEEPMYSPHGVQSPAGSGLIWVSGFGQNPNYYTKEYTIANNGPSPFQGVSQDHTAGNGNYFLYGDAPSKRCQGCSSPWTAVVWSCPVQVVSGRSYCFTAWFKNIGAGVNDPAKFQMEVNSSVVVAYQSVGGNNQWTQLGGTWTSNVTGTISISIQCKGKRAPIACDFGLDDIEFRGNVLDPPSIVATPTTFCSGQPVTLVGSGGDTYQWFDGNGNLIGTAASVVVTPTVTTTYTLYSYSSTPGCSEGSAVSITIAPSGVQPGIQFVPNACSGTLVNFNSMSNTNGLSPVIYSWNFGDGGTGSGSTVSHTYVNPGTYTVTLTTTDPCGNLSSVITVVNIIPSTSGYNADCCSQTQTYTHTGMIVVTNPQANPLIWSGQQYNVQGTIVIFPGAELDITNGSIIQFDPLSKIIVSPGAILKVENSTLTGLQVCGTMWQGVEVQGDKNYNQTQTQPSGSLYQGKMILTNSTISLAHSGVTLGGLNVPTSTYSPNKGGGILLATGSNFINCGYGVKFTPYPFVNISKITNCSFSSTTLPDPGYLTGNSYTYPNSANALYGYANPAQRSYCFVQTMGVRWVLMTGSVLNNSEYGLIGINSSLRVGGTQVGQGNSFSNMNQAEVHSNIFNSAFYSNRVYNNTYTNSLVPIQTWNGIGDLIFNNSIPLGAFVGIGSVGSQSVFINDNSISGGLLGVSVSNSGTMGGLVGYNASGNVFTQCVNGTWLPNNNPYLQVNCNTYINPNANNYVSNWRNFGVLANQGTLPVLTDKDPAGNTFFQTSPLRNQIESNNSIFDYYAHSADPSGVTVTVIPSPSGVLAPANVINTGVQQTNTSCVPGPPCGNCITQIGNQTTRIQQLEAEKDSIVSQMDGGQTQVLLNAINSNISSGQLKNLLLANSPLSDQVLLAYIARNGTPAGIFKDVIIPNSPVSKEVRPQLYNKIATMPTGIKNLIVSAQGNYQNRTLGVVEAELQSAIGERQAYYNQQLSYYVEKSETDTTANDSVKIALQEQNTEAAKEALAATYLAEENYTAASVIIDNLNPTSPEAQAQKDMLNLMLALYSSGRDVFQLSPSEETTVRNTAAMETECLARSNARVILFVAFGEPLDMDLQLESQRNQNQEFLEVIVDTTASYLGESFPNPAGDVVSMECNVVNDLGGNLSIFDVNGKVVYTHGINTGVQTITIDISNWPDGVYMCKLESGAQEVSSQKIVVAHD